MGSFLPLVTGAIWLFVVWRFVWPLPYGLGLRVLLALVLLAFAEYHWVTSNYFGSLASPELPQGVLIFLAWGFGTVLLLALLALLRDVAGLLLWWPWRGAGRALLNGQGVNQLVGVAAVFLAAYGVWQGVRVPDVKTIAIHVPGLPQSFDGYRLVQLTDTHASRLLPRYWQAAVVERSNRLHPDLIVITGDLSDGSTAARAADVAPLRDLSAPDGVIAIPGNHEYYANYQDWMQLYQELGLQVLENSHVVIDKDSDQLAIAGVTDRQAGSFGLPLPDLQAALDGIPANAPVILLDHRPENARSSARQGVALQLSGHTHGGQILGPHLLTKLANGGFVSGFYQLGAMTLYVSNGTGLWNGLALRLGRPAEITEIILRAAPKAD